MIKHICGQCTKTFLNEDEYLVHRCSVSGVSPKNNETTVYNNKNASPLEKKILTAVYTARREKRNQNE